MNPCRACWNLEFINGGLSVCFCIITVIIFVYAPQGDALQQGTEVSGYVVLP